MYRMTTLQQDGTVELSVLDEEELEREINRFLVTPSFLTFTVYRVPSA